MSDPFEYHKTVKLVPDTETTFRLDFISDGNEAGSDYYIDFGESTYIKNEEEVKLGLSNGLFGKKLKVTTIVNNVVAQEKNIALNYLINDKIAVEHNNLKGNSKSAELYVVLEFTQA